MHLNKDGKPVLQGDGSYGFEVIVDGADLLVRNARATWFGGDSDPLDSGDTASGVMTKGHPSIMGCALPMDFGPCKGSPIPKLPWHTKVRVFCHNTGKIIEVPLIDLGPNRPPKAHAQLDLTIAAFEALGVKHSVGELMCDYRIFGGAQFLSAAVKRAIREGEG